MADEESAEARKRLDAALLNFRSGQLNCLVSTQVLEEGMDVKRCNLVVRFDRIQTFRSYVQAGYYSQFCRRSKSIAMNSVNST